MDQQAAEAAFEAHLRAHLTHMYRDLLGHPDYEWRILRRRNEVEREKLLLRCQESHSCGVHGLRVLNVGSGWGGYMQACMEAGAEAYGLDTDAEVVAICNLRLRSRGLAALNFIGAGERMPFPDDAFDRINCFSVLEHVRDVRLTLLEIIRVLKPGGIAYLHFPDHRYPFEGHYKITWIPFLPKPLARAYLAVLGRPNRFIEHIRYLSPGRVRRMVEGQPIAFERLPNDFYALRRLKAMAGGDEGGDIERTILQTSVRPDLPLRSRIARALDARLHKHVLGPLFGLVNIAPICNVALRKSDRPR